MTIHPANANNGALVVLSGGQDSTTVLYHALNKTIFKRLHCLTINYGQRHAIEILSAQRVVAAAQAQYPHKTIEHEILTVGDILASTSPLVKGGGELEQYRDWTVLPGGIEKTFVPMRNQLFLTLAANRAVAAGMHHVYTGVSQEDYGGYPDCREAFIKSLEQAINVSLDGVWDVRIMTPLMFLSKSETVKYSRELPGCWEALAYTHTAYDGQYPPIGQDHATLLRAKGFAEAGLPDPLVERAWKEGLMALPPSANYDYLRSVNSLST